MKIVATRQMKDCKARPGEVNSTIGRPMKQQIAIKE